MTWSLEIRNYFVPLTARELYNSPHFYTIFCTSTVIKSIKLWDILRWYNWFTFHQRWGWPFLHFYDIMIRKTTESKSKTYDDWWLMIGGKNIYFWFDRNIDRDPLCLISLSLITYSYGLWWSTVRSLQIWAWMNLDDRWRMLARSTKNSVYLFLDVQIRPVVTC